jgi:hypothetical protein
MYREVRKATIASSLGLALLLAACGSSAKPSTTTDTASVSAATTTTSARSATAASEKVPNVDIPVKIPVLQKGSPLIPARYTCDGAGVSPPVTWSGVPVHTVEIDLFVVSLAKGTAFSAWSVAGLNPHLHALPAGRLPSGTILGRNRSGKLGYTLCPPRGARESYVMLVFALPQRIHVRPGFNPASLIDRASKISAHEGQLIFSYQRV